MIRAFIKTSLVDWDGKIVSVLFFDRCNFRCPFCQNWRLLCRPDKFPAYDFEQILKETVEKKHWIDGFVLTGGEPLLFYNDIMAMARRIKELNMLVKLDTNGSFPDRLSSLIELRLIDYVAMDIKAPLDSSYLTAVGKKAGSKAGIKILDNIIKSMNVLIKSDIESEFRTTCVPSLIDEQAIRKIGEKLKGARRWFLQHYISINAFRKSFRNKQYDDKTLNRLLEVAREYFPGAKLR